MKRNGLDGETASAVGRPIMSSSGNGKPTGLANDAIGTAQSRKETTWVHEEEAMYNSWISSDPFPPNADMASADRSLVAGSSLPARRSPESASHQASIIVPPFWLNIADFWSPPPPAPHAHRCLTPGLRPICLNTCRLRRNGFCDDSGIGGNLNCRFGTDCDDCGPRYTRRTDTHASIRWLADAFCVASIFSVLAHVTCSASHTCLMPRRL